MSVISTGLTPKLLLPGAVKVFGDAYKDVPTFYDKIFDVRASDRSYEEHTLVHGMGVAQAKPEGTAIAYDTMKQLYTQRFTHVTYALGYVITEEAMEDVKAVEVSVMRAKQLKKALMVKREMVAADLLNNAFDSNFAFADGKEVCATDHPCLNGNQSNELSTAADLSEASLEQLLINIKKATDVKGIRISLKPSTLVLPVELEPTAFRLLQADLRPGTADNDPNWLKGSLKVISSPYLSDADAWFVKTDAEDGMVMYNRRDMRLEQDGDFDTSNMRFKGSNRYSLGIVDWRGVFGSPGA